MTRRECTTPPSSFAGRGRRGALALVFACILLTGCTTGGPAAPEHTPPISEPTPVPSISESVPEVGSDAGSEPPRESSVLLGEGVAPASVAIPAIDLDEPLIPLGIAPEGDIEVPADYNDVGWFAGGGKPGGRGPTVIAAHVDSGWGPAIFARLTDLVPGDLAEVTDIEGEVTTYRVTEVADHPRADFPTARVFGAHTTDVLRLITCTGFDPDVSEYLMNRVVYAESIDG